jgi:hypothetical protein
MAIFVAAMLVRSGPARTQSALSVKDVMQRVERYVESYGEVASIVVGTERYQQESRSSDSSAAATRTLRSDVAIVRADAIRGWLGFRDVIDVDGRRVTDREDRLARILMGAEGRYDEARRLSDESARFNIGAIERNFNVPTTALFFFRRENHDRFRFAARRVADDGTWEIAFKETATPTLIRSPEGKSAHSSGTIWVQPDSGTVVRTVLAMEILAGSGKTPPRGTGHVDVTYRLVEALNMWLPATMDEEFEASQHTAIGRGGRSTTTWDRVDGHAEYSNYRQFTTSARIK